MKAVVQRVIDASVSVNGILKGKIDSGLLVYFGVAHNDSEKDADWLAEKIAYLRIFNDAEGKMNLSLLDLKNKNLTTENTELHGEDKIIGVLVISQFTLLADAKKGRRPSYGDAAAPEKAKQLYEYFIKAIKSHDLLCENGEFQAHMMVSYTNDGPVTIVLDSVDRN